MVAALVVASHQAGAQINDSKFGDPGELFISVWDEANARSYYKDLGLSMTDFIAGKGCLAGDLASDPNYTNFSGAQDLVFNIAAANSLVRDPAGNPVNIQQWGYAATSSGGAGIFNASFSAIDNTKQKIQGYIGRLNGDKPFTNAPGEAAVNSSGVFQANGLGYHGGTWWGSSMGKSVNGSTEGVPGTAVEFYFVNNSNGSDSGKQVTKLGEFNLAGGKLSYSGTGTSTLCGSGPVAPGKYSLTVTKTGDGQGVVISTPAALNCGTICSAEFDKDSNVTLAAAASSGSTFAGWSGACSGTSLTCTVKLSATTSVQAAFSAAGVTPPPPPPPPVTGPSIKIAAPTIWNVNMRQTITWNEAEVSPKSKVKVSYSKNGGAKFSTLKEVKVVNRQYVWKPAKKHLSNNAVLRICVKPDPKKKAQVCDSSRLVVQP